MKKMLKRLQEITNNCRFDMHEPDEQDLEARVVGDHLDNAFGERIDEEMLEGGYQEFVVVLQKRDSQGRRIIERFNLATLIALARLARLE